MAVTPVVVLSPGDFDGYNVLSNTFDVDEPVGYEDVTTNSAAVIHVDGADVLQITDLSTAQRGTAFKQIPGLTAADDFAVHYQMYTGGGSGADGQCVSVGANKLAGRSAEDGVAEGLALCFDEYANGGDHGIQVRKTPSWPRSWANFSRLSLYSRWNAWANWHLLGQPDTFLASGVL